MARTGSSEPESACGGRPLSSLSVPTKWRILSRPRSGLSLTLAEKTQMWPLAPTTSCCLLGSHDRQYSGPLCFLPPSEPAVGSFPPALSLSTTSPLLDHAMMKPSIEHENRIRNSAANSSPVTQPECSRRVRISSPVSAPHT
eukprot:scaffold269876_cov33-Tisochrysis_lutea.AAC.1